MHFVTKACTCPKFSWRTPASPNKRKAMPTPGTEKSNCEKKRNKNFSQCRQYKLHLTFSIKSVSRTFGIVWRTGIFGKNLRLEPQRSATVKQGQNDMPFRTRLLGTESCRLQNQSKSATKMCLLVDFKLISSWLHLEWNWLNDCIVLICLVLLMASPLYAIVTSFVTYCDRQYGLCFALLRFASVLCFRPGIVGACWCKARWDRPAWLVGARAVPAAIPSGLGTDFKHLQTVELLNNMSKLDVIRLS